ncbi:MAG: type II toxin-antitoxin system RelB/DinJ family antitoxin [Rhodocyclaceae bacterium]
MEGEIIRFRVDPAVKEKVAAVCEKLGFDLSEVLRAVMGRIAETGTLPIELASTSEPRSQRAPFGEYSERLWRDYQYVDTEVALTLLDAFIARSAAQLNAEQSSQAPNPGTIETLKRVIAEARQLTQTLDPDDAPALAAVLAAYGPKPAPTESHGEP